MIITSDGIRERVGRREFLGLAVGAFVVAAVPMARWRPSGVVRRTVPAMGTVAEFAVVHRDPMRAHAAIDAAVAELRWVERTMTRFTDSSDIGRANLFAARDAVVVAPQTAHVVGEALRWAEAVDGRFDPACGAISQLWSVTSRREPPLEESIQKLAGRRFHRAVEIGVRGGEPILRYHDRNARLDLGAVAKGYAVDRAVAALRGHGVSDAVLVAGGDLYALGSGPGGQPWAVGIQSPTEPDGILERLHLSNRAVATSGTYRQYFEHAGRRYHHLMDPEVARPRVTSMQSLTIVADSVMQADAAATALYGLSAEAIANTLARHLPDARVARIA